jgi:hypothetical protein
MPTAEPAAAAAAAVPAAAFGEERRVAPDGQMYTAGEFQAYFGGLNEWHAAHQTAIGGPTSPHGPPPNVASQQLQSMLGLVGAAPPSPMQQPAPPVWQQQLAQCGVQAAVPQTMAQQPAFEFEPPPEDDFAMFAQQTQAWQDRGRR